MSLFDKISNALKEANLKKQQAQEQSAIALKEKRAASIPVIQSVVDKYKVPVKFLDTDAYIYVTEEGKERGIYIPYGTTEAQADIKIDKFVNNFESASKHKTRDALAKTANVFMKIGDGYDHLNEDIEKLESKKSNVKVKGFWENAPTMDSLKSGTAPKFNMSAIKTNTNIGNSLKGTTTNNKKQDTRDSIPLDLRRAIKARANHKCERCKVQLGGKIVGHVHHKNGDNNDNRYENLEYLCPNCHSIGDKEVRRK